jgi:CheY-like chemotaxis protein
MTDTRPHVLVVDDNPDTRLTLQLLLEHEGYSVSLAANGAQALAEQRRRAAQVMITDLFMPDTDGFETIQSFRREYPEIKVVAISGDVEGLRDRYLEVASLIGVDATLAKPVDSLTLLETVAGLSHRDHR